MLFYEFSRTRVFKRCENVRRKKMLREEKEPSESRENLYEKQFVKSL